MLLPLVALFILVVGIINYVIKGLMNDWDFEKSFTGFTIACGIVSLLLFFDCAVIIVKQPRADVFKQDYAYVKSLAKMYRESDTEVDFTTVRLLADEMGRLNRTIRLQDTKDSWVGILKNKEISEYELIDINKELKK